MIVFCAICAVLIVLALALILPPLRHPERIAAAGTTTQANIAVYRRQLAEMTLERDHRMITDEHFQRDREELEQRLIVDLPRDSATSRTETIALRADILIYVLAIGLPVTAILLYLMLGTPSSLGRFP